MLGISWTPRHQNTGRSTQVNKRGDYLKPETRHDLVVLLSGVALGIMILYFWGVLDYRSGFMAASDYYMNMSGSCGGLDPQLMNIDEGFYIEPE